MSTDPRAEVEALPMQDPPNTHKYRTADHITTWMVIPLHDPVTGIKHYYHVPSVVVEEIEAAILARPATPSEGLDVERLGDAIVAAVRAERAPIGYKGDGWPAYWEKDRPATVLNVDSLAKRLAAEYARLASTEPSAEHDHSGCAHGDHTCPVCHASTEPSAD